MSAFLCENRKNSLAAGGSAPTPHSLRRLGALPLHPACAPPPFQILGAPLVLV